MVLVTSGFTASWCTVMSEKHEYHTFSKELVNEGRRVYALDLACEMMEGETAAKILKLAKQFEGYLEGAKPKLKAVKNDPQ
jgi:hypothetical protein